MPALGLLGKGLQEAEEDTPWASLVAETRFQVLTENTTRVPRKLQCLFTGDSWRRHQERVQRLEQCGSCGHGLCLYVATSGLRP